MKGKTNGELLKIINENEPIMPSAITNYKLQTKTKDQNPQLKGNIDNIILKLLAKESIRRYKTVEQFSGDIWRHLDGLPILAHFATVPYQAQKFFKCRLA